MGPVRFVLALCLVAAVAAGCGESPAGITSNDLGRTTASYDAKAPNIVVVMTDDQALDTMRAMPKTQRLLGERGTTFSDSVVSFPLCCPSRAAFLTGQYARNNHVRSNKPPKGSISALDQSATLPVWLRKAGYDTTFVGKYLNGYGKDANGGPTYVPPGWVHWYGVTARDKTSAYDYDINENGELVHYGTDETDYKTDVMARQARKAVRRSAGKRRPFFLWVATSDPHTDNGLAPRAKRNPLPAPRDLGSFGNAEPPRARSFDEADVSDKPPYIRKQSRLSAGKRAKIRRLYVSQLESLGAVDDLVAGLVRELRRAGELENTIVVFTSDNGFVRGQHRITSGKSLIYGESIRVPLIMAGPGIPAGKVHRDPVANVDLTPTFLAAAGIKTRAKQDGVPLQPILAGRRTRPPVLLEIYGRKDGDVFGVHTADFTYAEHNSGFVELYDLRNDPLELDNVAGRPAYAAAQDRLEADLQRLRHCAGRTCR